MQLTFKHTCLAAAAALMASLSGNSVAADNFQVDASVVQSCVLTVPGALDFGTYDATGVNLTEDKTAQANINVKCAAGTSAATVYISKGTTQQGTYSTCSSGPRQMFLNGVANATTSGDIYSSQLYHLYKNPEHNDYWGCADGTASTGGKAVGPFVSSVTPITMTVYGVVPKNQFWMTVGSYSDVVSVWVSF